VREHQEKGGISRSIKKAPKRKEFKRKKVEEGGGGYEMKWL